MEPIFPVNIIDEQFKTIANMAPVLIWAAGTDKSFYFFNQSWLKFTGISAEHAIANGLIEAIHPDDRDHYIDIYNSGFDGHDDFNIKYRLKRRDGVYRTVADKIFPRFNDDGEFLGYTGWCMDIEDLLKPRPNNTDLEEKVKQQAAALSASVGNFRNVILQGPIAMGLFTGMEMTLDIVNDRFLELWGKDRSILGKPLLKALPELEDQPYLQIMQDVYNTGTPYFGNESLVYLHRNGKLEEGYYNFINHPFRNENGVISGIIVVAMEVTEQVLARKAVEKVYSEQQTLNEELTASNEELVSINEEQAATHEELTEVNANLQKTAEELAASESRFRLLVDEAPVAIFILNGPNHIIESANTLKLQMVGKTADIIGKPLAEAMPELAGQPFLKLLDGVYASGQPYYGAESQATIERNGELVDNYYNFIYQPIIEADKVTGIMIVTTDVTEFVLAKQVLEKSEERQRLAVEGTGVATWDLNLVTDELVHTPRLAEIFGFNDTIVLSHNNFRDALHPEDIKVQKLAFNKALVTSEHFYEARIIWPDESLHWIRSQGKLFYNEQGEAVRMLGTTVDITEQHKIIEDLRSSEEQLRLATNAADLGTFDMDLTKGTMNWDSRCRELFGISHEGDVNYEQDFLGGLHEDDRERVGKLINDLFDKSISNGDYDVEYRTVGVDDNKERWVRAMGKVFFNEKNEAMRFIGSVLEITEKKKDELRKNDFIGMVSHELKTPLTSLSAIIQVLNMKLKNSDDPFISGALDKATIQVKKMGSMINGFLNISRFEAGKIQIEKQYFNLDGLIAEMIKETELTVSSHQVIFEPCGPVNIFADKDKIGSVISNLISNGIKYSPKGKTIIVKCEVIQNEVQVSFTDQGLGIKIQDQERLFDRYYRVQSNHTQNISGFGIGLYLSAEIIKRHGGKIGVESQIGVGSTFCFSLPLN